MYRKTYVEINENVLENNVCNIKKNYPDYEYYFGVVKGNAYGHGMHVVNALIKGGINYLAVATLEEALVARGYNKEIPILCFGYISLSDLSVATDNNITISIVSFEHYKELITSNLRVKAHLKVNSGLNRMGVKNKFQVQEIVSNASKYNIDIEGIYTHYGTSGVTDIYWDMQTKNFEDLTSLIDLSKIKIVHGFDSLSLVKHDKKKYYNGVRLGIVMYGYASSVKVKSELLFHIKKAFLLKGKKISATHMENALCLKKALKIKSEVIKIDEVLPNEVVGYYANFRVKEKSFIAIIPIGYADGINACYSDVLINGHYYPILSFSMDYIMVKVDNRVHLYDVVDIINEDILLSTIASKQKINICNALLSITSRLPRMHIYDDEVTEIKY